LAIVQVKFEGSALKKFTFEKRILLIAFLRNGLLIALHKKPSYYL